MKESDLRRLLPDGIADFNDWHAQISKYNTPLMRHLDSLDIPEKKENSVRVHCQRSQCRTTHKRKDC